MKIQITGICTTKLQLVKWVKDVTGLGLKESKELCEPFVDNHSITSLIIEISTSYVEAEKLFFSANLNNTVTLKKYRVEIIENFLRKNDPDWNNKSDKDYDKYFELFEYLFKNDKESLKKALNDSVDNLKNKLNDFKIQ